jgi:hypothetical protein
MRFAEKAVGMFVWHADTQTLLDGDDVEFLPKRYWSECDCGSPYLRERADCCAFCERGV